MSKGGLGIDSRTDDPNPHPVHWVFIGGKCYPQLEVEWDPVRGTRSR